MEHDPRNAVDTNHMLGEPTALQKAAGLPMTFFAEITPDRPVVRHFRAGLDQPIKMGHHNRAAPQPALGRVEASVPA